MSKQKKEKPIEKIKKGTRQAVRAESAPAPVRRYRALLFQGLLVVFAGGFAVLTFLVKTTPSFAIDLQVTKAIQMINFPGFAWFMSLISWPGFGPQSMIITALTILMIYGLGLHWEALMALFAAVFSTGINLLAKNLVQRPRPLASMVNVFDRLNDYSFPSGHVMFYIFIGASRIYLGAHWASDVLAAYLLGSLTLIVTIQIYLWGKTRFFVHQPVAAAEPQPAHA
jgi:membrane-associated phospholipid phosphatase